MDKVFSLLGLSFSGKESSGSGRVARTGFFRLFLKSSSVAVSLSESEALIWHIPVSTPDTFMGLAVIAQYKASLLSSAAAGELRAYQSIL